MDLLTAIEQQRDQALADVTFLRDQLQQERSAGQELRVMLARLERTNSELAGALVVKALPPADVQFVQPRRLRWWQVWRRGVPG